MPSVKSRGCASSLFKCFGSRSRGGGDRESQRPDVEDRRKSSNGSGKSGEVKPAVEPQASDGVRSNGSGDDFFDTDEGFDHEWSAGDNEEDRLKSPLSDNDQERINQMFPPSLNIDGQFFFCPREITDADYEGIFMYPPVTTTEVDPPHPNVTLENMSSLLHPPDAPPMNETEARKRDEADVDVVGKALEGQARRMMGASDVGTMRRTTVLLLEDLKKPQVKINERGFPGELTSQELEAVKLFRSQLREKDPVFSEIINSFCSVEQEAYALCRFLRARKFDVERVFLMLEEVSGTYKVAKSNDFYRDFEQALGVPRSVFLSQYPAVYSGNARNGCPVMYLRAGSIQPEGLKCLLELDAVDRFFWNDVIYTFASKLQEGRKRNSQFVRCENISVYDLKGVSRAQISGDTLEVIKMGNSTMSAFPETLHCLLIINAPGWFGMVWSVIKKLIDPRTASKIQVFTSSKAATVRMLELVESEQLPPEYGGTGPSLSKAAASGVGGENGGTEKVVTFAKLMSIRKKGTGTHEIELHDNEKITLTLYTRCRTGAKVVLLRDATVMTEIDAVGEEEDKPFHRMIGDLSGPGTFQVTIKSHSLAGYYLLVGHSYG